MNDLQRLREQWDDVVAACARRNRQAASLLMLSEPVSVSPFGDGYIQVILETHFAQHRDTMTENSSRVAIQGAIETILGHVTLIDVRVRAGKTSSSTNVSTPKLVTPQRAKAKAKTLGGSGRVTSIPTEYGGVMFRSKLEAGFAQLFDRAGLDWEFESEGYNLNGIWYLPDLWLPDIDTIIEVKGILDANAETKATRLAEAAKGNNIQVIITQRLRPQSVQGLTERFIAGTLVSDGKLFEAASILVRCPQCKKSSWKAPGLILCPRCHKKNDPEQYLPVR